MNYQWCIVYELEYRVYGLILWVVNLIALGTWCMSILLYKLKIINLSTSRDLCISEAKANSISYMSNPITSGFIYCLKKSTLKYSIRLRDRLCLTLELLCRLCATSFIVLSSYSFIGHYMFRPNWPSSEHRSSSGMLHKNTNQLSWIGLS
jgi:hypothetical protein